MRLYANFLYLKLIKIYITFLLLSMPKKRNHHPLNKPKSAAAIYLEESHAFDSGHLSSLTHNNNFDALSSSDGIIQTKELLKFIAQLVIIIYI